MPGTSVKLETVADVDRELTEQRKALKLVSGRSKELAMDRIDRLLEVRYRLSEGVTDPVLDSSSSSK